jgi:diguanylate cyclase (GGDEF)-like protein/PAS domain S-box-containing protein
MSSFTETLRQQQLEIARLRSELSKHQAFLDAVKVHIWAFDGTQYTYTNRQWFEFTGQNPNELLSIERWISAVHPEDLEASTAIWLAHWESKTEHENFFRLRRHDGVYRDFYCHAIPVCNANGVFEYFQGFNLDITDRKKAEEEIKYLAFYDPLTGLANRRLLTDRMGQHLAHARRAAELVAVCMIDLDGFKQVNDQFGHKTGDLLLIEVARRLQASMRQSDTASRLGGDEFALLLGGFTKVSECEQLLQRIIANLAAPYAVNNAIAHVTASIGVTVFPNDGNTPDLLLRHADQAMYEAKHAGKNCFCLFNPSHLNQQHSNQAMLIKIGKALQSGQFVLFYQPQVDCRVGKVVGMEALIRWKHPILGLLAPSEFIPLLEHDDLIIGLGEWVLLEALRQQKRWREAGVNLNIGINIAARQLHQGSFVARLVQLLADFDAEVIHQLTLEIVETAALEDINVVADAIRQCRELGLHVAIDDFGTGFSSLAHLKHLQVDTLKIDQSFVLGMLCNPQDRAIAKGVIGLASSFDYKVIAEGVESLAHVQMLMDMGCDVMQGYVIAHPIAPADVLDWLNKFEPNPFWRIDHA